MISMLIVNSVVFSLTVLDLASIPRTLVVAGRKKIGDSQFQHGVYLVPQTIQKTYSMLHERIQAKIDHKIFEKQF